MDEKDKKADTIIANDGNDFTADDKAMLLKLNEDALDAMLAPAEDDKKPAEKSTATKLPTANADDTELLTLAKVTELFTTVLPDLVANAVKAERESEIRPDVLARLKANTACTFGNEILDDMSTPALTALEQQVAPEFYTGAGSPRTNTDAIDDAHTAGPMPVLFEVA